MPGIGTWCAWPCRRVRMPAAKSREGRIVEVLERGCREVPVHVIHVAGRRALCRPADSRMPFDVSVELPGDMERPSGGSLLLVAPEKRLAADLWQARLLQAVGREDDIAVQEDLVKLNHEVPREFLPGSRPRPTPCRPRPSMPTWPGARTCARCRW